MVPECKLVPRVTNKCQTFVAKLSEYAAADKHSWKEALVVEGCHPSAFAIVIVEFATEPGLYIVLTTTQPRHTVCFADKFKTALETSPTTKVDWVKPLTVRLQRLFGWGDVTASAKEISEACEREDLTELEAILPGSACLLDKEIVALQQIPQVAKAAREALPAIKDCAHDFDEPVPRRASDEPCLCARCGGCNSLQQFFARCKACKQVFCGSCANDYNIQAEEQRAILRAAHELTNGHIWVTSERAECKGAGAKCKGDKVEGGCCVECAVCNVRPAMQCVCGLQRCEAHLPPPAAALAYAPSYIFEHSAVHPQPFFVLDFKKCPESEKLLWLQQELGSSPSVDVFAAKYLELFGDKVHGTRSQKKAILELYGKYGDAPLPVPWLKDSDMPPHELEAFKRVWDDKTPHLCRECAARIPEGRANYCSGRCELGGATFRCKTCSKELDANHPYCTECKHGGAAPSKKCDPDQAAQMSMQQRMLFGGILSKDADYEPAWKCRRRS